MKLAWHELSFPQMCAQNDNVKIQYTAKYLNQESLDHIMHHRLLIFQIYLKTFDKDLRLILKTLKLILRINLRLGGYSIWSAIFIAPHKEDQVLKILNLLGQEAPRSFEAAREVLEEFLQDQIFKRSRILLQKYQKPAVIGYEELGGLSDPRPQDSLHGTDLYGIRDRVCPIP